MSSKSFTERQGQYLAFIDAYTRVHGRPPAETDLQRHFRRQPAIGAPDGAHVGTRRPHPPPARGGAQHRGVGGPRSLPVLRHPNPSNPLCRGTSASWHHGWRCRIEETAAALLTRPLLAIQQRLLASKRGEMVRGRSRTDICPSTVSRTLHSIWKQETVGRMLDVLAVWQPKAASLVCFDASTIRQDELACVS